MRMQSFTAPGKLYFKQGCLPVALMELKTELHKRFVLIIADDTVLRSHKIGLLTRALGEMQITCAVNTPSFPPDCVIGIGTAETLDRAAEAANGQYFIAIPTAPTRQMSVAAWQKADMMILDEDLCELPEVKAACAHIAETAKGSLVGGNASDYTLSLAVHALRTVFGGRFDPSALLHAAASAQMAYAAAYTDTTPGTDLFPDAAEALGMTAEELDSRIQAMTA